MSLLMDALKRAEESKREQGQNQGAERATPPSEMRLEPISSVAPSAKIGPSTLPDLNSHIASVEADLKAAAAEQPAPANSAKKPNEGADRAQAKNLFTAGAAKPVAPVQLSSSNKVRIAAIIGAGVLAAAGVGGYFYWQLQSISQNSNRLAGPGLGATPIRAPLPQPIATNTPISAAAIVGSPLDKAPTAHTSTEPTPTAPTEVAAQTTLAAKSPPILPNVPPAQSNKPTPSSQNVPNSRSAVAMSPRTAKANPKGYLNREKSATDSTDGTPKSKPAEANSLLVSSQSHESHVMQGYNALQAGRFADAKTAYTQALRNDPRDRDALLGLASLARRDGDNGLAGDYYERVLRTDPRNASAHAGIVALQGGGDAAQAESRLKSLISLQSSDANATSSLNFALGNLYSGQRRWSDAQQAYFNAHTADPGNPDTLYNLAISLEHLSQKPLARKFYAEALEASRLRPSTFERTQVEQRLSVLDK